MIGIDVSHYQDGLDLPHLKDSEYGFAILKLSEGRGLADSAFDRFYSLSEGIPIGAYVYSHATNASVATEEAVFALSLLQGRKLPLGIFMDVETDAQLRLPKEQLKETVMAFVRTVTNAGYRAGIYGSELGVWSRLSIEDFKEYSIWVAHYGKAPAIYCDIWQRTDKGSFPTYYGMVDVDEVMSDRFKNMIEGETVKDPVAATFPPDPSIMVLQAVLQYNGYWDKITGYKSKEFFSALREFTDDMEAQK